LAVATFDFEADDDGTLRVFGTVENRGDARRTGTVRVVVGVDDEELVRETDVAVDSDSTAEWTVTVDVAYDRFAAGGNISVALD